MAGLLSAFSWLIDNWQTIATAFSALSSISLFFMHGTNKQSLQELRDFINSVHVSQDQPSAKQNAELKNPKI